FSAFRRPLIFTLFPYTTLFRSLWLLGGALMMASAQSGIRVLVVNEFANVRIVPAIGAEVLGSVPGGYVFENVNARSADGQWIRVDRKSTRLNSSHVKSSYAVFC